MPETACLHIQARESDPIRVVELPGTSVRIGRAPFCEVHLPEPALADEECELRRRGATWHLVPVAAPGALSIEGRLVDRPRPLPYGVALRVGDFSLTLRPACAAPPDWSAAAAAAAAPRPAAASSAAMHDRLRSAPSSPRAATAEREKQWEARWKAAADRLREASATAVAPPPPATPTAAPIPERPRAGERLGGWRQAELPRRDGTRPATRSVNSANFPSLKTVSAPSAYPRPQRSAATPLTATAPAPTARIPGPPTEDEVEAVFIPPSDLDWAEAEAAHTAFEVGVPPSAEPVPDLLFPVVEEAEPAAVLEAHDAEDDRDSAPHTNAWHGVVPSSPAHTQAAWPVAHTEHSTGVAYDEPEADPPVEDSERAIESALPSEVDGQEGSEDAPLRTPGLLRRVGLGIRSLWGRKSRQPSNLNEADSTPAPAELEAAPPEPTTAPVELTECRASRVEDPQRDTQADPRLSDADAAVVSSAPADPVDQLDEPDRAAAFDQSPVETYHERAEAAPDPAADVQSIAEQPVSPAVDAGGTETAPPRRPLIARRRAKPRTRIPRLGNVRVVPNDEAAAPAPTAPTQERAPMAGNRSEGRTEVPPERPRGAESSPFTARTWQADTRPWHDLGTAAVSTSTWDAGVGREGHAVRPPHGPGASHEASSNQSWPSARDILAARVQPRAASAPIPKASPKRPQPTVAQEPEHLTLPLWLGWPPLAASAIAASLLGVALAWTWGQDARTAGVIATDLRRTKTDGKFPLAPEELPPAVWWRSTGGALARRAAALGRSDDADPEEVRNLLTVATQAAPLEPSARLALARIPARDDDTPVRLKSIGLSRDALALAWTGRQLLKAGQKESAVRAYRRALEIAATADVSRLAEATYNDDPQVRRFVLPGEDLIGQVVRDMAGHTEWAFEDWSPALPSYAVAPLVAARLLREHDRSNSDALVDRLTGEDESRVPPPGTPAAIHIAARAEAFALKREWAQAQGLYQHAIELIPSDRVKRSWQINLADLALRQNDDAARQKALDAANNHDPNDPITLRAVELQKAPGERTARGTAALREEGVGRAANKVER